MGHEVLDDEKCVKVGGLPWHMLGFAPETPISAMAAHELMNGSFDLTLEPVAVVMQDQILKVENHFAIVRGPTNKDKYYKVFDYVKGRYHLVQPIDIFQMFDDKVGVGIESAGLIQDGRKMFLSWPIDSIDVSGAELKLFGNVMFGFDKVFSSRLCVATHYIVCKNTFMGVLGEAEQDDKKRTKGRGTIYSGKHTNPNLLKELGEWMGFVQKNSQKEVDLVSQFFGKMATTPIVHEKQAQDLIEVSWPEPIFIPERFPEEQRERREKETEDLAARNQKIRDSIYNIYAGPNDGAFANNEETYWRLFNAGTNFWNHNNVRESSAYSVLYGDRSKEMNRFAEVLRDDMNARS